MANCTKIRLRQTPMNFPSKWIALDGFVYLDVSTAFSITIDKVLEKLTDVNELEFDRIISGNFDITPKMDAILECFLDSNTIGQEYQEIPIDVIQGSTINSDTCLRIDDCDANNGIEASIILDKNHWARRMSELTLHDLYEGENYTHFCLTSQQLGDNYIYNESTPYWLPTVDYGAFGFNNSVTRIPLANNPDRFRSYQNFCNSYRRPWLFTADVLRRLFCEINYQFKSELTEKEMFNRLIEYHVRNDFGIDNASELNFSAQPQGNYLVFNSETGAFQRLFFNADQDPNSLWQDSYYCGNGKVRINISLILSFELTPLQEEQEIVIRLRQVGKENDPETSPVRTLEEFQINSSTVKTENDIQSFTIEIEDLELDLSACNRFYFEMTSNAQKNFTIDEGSNVTVEGIRKFFDDDRIYPWSDVLKSTNMLDWFKGLTHMFNLKFASNIPKREVCFDPPYKIIVDGEACNGFFEDDCIDLTNIQQEKSKRVVSPNRDEERFVTKQFKSSNDTFIKDKELETEPYILNIDRGTQYNNITSKEIENSQIEPTLNRLVFNITRTDLNLPVLRNEGDVRCQSWDFECARILCTYGSVNHVDFDGELFDFCGQITNLVPTAYQYEPNFTIGQTSNVFSPKVTPSCNLTFERLSDANGNTLLSLASYSYRWLLEELLESEYTYLFHLDEYTFDCIDFRKLAKINHNGKPIITRITEVLDFDRCVDDLTNISFRPLSQALDVVCSKSVVTTNDPTEIVCQNSPVIICTIVDNCILFAIGGSNASIMQSVQFINNDTGLIIPNLSNTTAEICDATEVINVYAIVTYDNTGQEVICPPETTPIKTISPCNNNAPIIIPSGVYKNNGDYCITASIGGLIFDTFTIDSFTVDGNTYNEGDEVCGLSIGQVLLFEATIDFDDNCDPIPISLEVVVPVQSIDCDSQTAEIGFEDVDGCCVPFIIESCFATQSYNTFFWYLCLPDGETPGDDSLGTLWDNATPICCTDVLWVRAMIIFCDTCPPLCVDWFTAVKEGCCSGVVITCSMCEASFEPCDGYTYEWYSLTGENDPSNQPNFDSITIQNTFPLLGTGSTVTLPDDIDLWYAVIGTKDGCVDTVDYYYHDAPNAGDDTNVTI